MKILRLNPQIHNRAAFDSGEEKLDLFLQKYANQAAKKGESETYVLVGEKDPCQILGFHTILSKTISYDIFPLSIGTGEISVMLLARIATLKTLRGKGYGELLMWHVFLKTVEKSEGFDLQALILDAKNSEVKKIYHKWGFRELLDSPFHLYITLQEVKQALK